MVAIALSVFATKVRTWSNLVDSKSFGIRWSMATAAIVFGPSGPLFFFANTRPDMRREINQMVMQ